jgi:hypothetical protein
MTDAMLIFHFIGLMMGAGGGLGATVALAHALALPPEQAGPIRSLGPSLANVSAAGLVLMLATGVVLTVLKYGGFGAMPVMFWVKMTFVATLTIAVVLIQITHGQVRRGNAAAAARLPRLGSMAGISSLLAVIFAVLAFR